MNDLQLLTMLAAARSEVERIATTFIDEEHAFIYRADGSVLAYAPGVHRPLELDGVDLSSDSCLLLPKTDSVLLLSLADVRNGLTPADFPPEYAGHADTLADRGILDTRLWRMTFDGVPLEFAKAML